jgi:hypothetical protein
MRTTRRMRFLITDQAPGDQLRTLAGGKAHNLHTLTAAGFPVPRWAVLGTDAFHAAVAAAGLQLSDAPLSLSERQRRPLAGEIAAARTAVQAQVREDALVWLIGVPRGSLLRTSSGKPRRYERPEQGISGPQVERKRP